MNCFDDYNLQLFAEGGEGEGEAAGAAEPAESAEAAEPEATPAEEVAEDTPDGSETETPEEEPDSTEKAERDRRSRLFDGWARQAKELKGEFPGFEFTKELRSPRFFRLLEGGATVKEAYVALHYAELMEENGRRAARRAKEAVASSVRANGMRPVENGLGSGAPTSRKTDISAMSLKDINALFERAGSGERITLK